MMDDGSAPKSSSLRAQEVEATMAEKKGWYEEGRRIGVDYIDVMVVFLLICTCIFILGDCTRGGCVVLKAAGL